MLAAVRAKSLLRYPGLYAAHPCSLLVKASAPSRKKALESSYCSLFFVATAKGQRGVARNAIFFEAKSAYLPYKPPSE